MNLAEFSVKNSLLVNLISFFIFFFGLLSTFQIRREAFPDVSFDIVSIQTVYRGAPPEDVEKLVTIPIEKELKSVSGVKEMNSSSEEGISIIGIIIDPREKDKKKVVNDIHRAVDRVEGLPEESDEPLVEEMTTKEMPIIEISLSGDYPESQIRQYAEKLEGRLLDLTDVAAVNRMGWRERQIWVEVDPEKMRDFHVSLDEIILALRARNVTVPGGHLQNSETEFSIRITGEFNTPQEVEGVVIRANDSGYGLKVKDVANVKDTFEDENRIAKINGHRALVMVVIKRELADAINVTDQVKHVVNEFRIELPQGLEITLTNDFSYYVKRRLNVLKSNGLQGFILVVLILFLFLDPVPAIATALGIPFALFSTFAIMNFLGLSINLITMLGLIIVLGMLVDDGIVVSENVYRHIEQGLPAKQAAILGTSEVISPIMGSIITTWAAFFPMLFMKDLIGKFIHSIPIIIIIALAASIVEAFVVLPSHSADWGGRSLRKNFSRKIKTSQDHSWFQRIVNGYTFILRKAIHHRYLVFIGMIFSFLLAIYLALFHMKIILFTGEGMERFYIRAEAKKGTSLQKMNELIVRVEDLVAGLPKEDMDSFRTYLGSIDSEGRFDPEARRGTHLGQITVFLTPLQQRKRSPEEMINSLRPQLEKIEGFEKLYFFKPREGPPVGRPVAVGIRGKDYNVLQEIAEKFRSALQEIPGVSDISVGYEYGKKQLRVIVDEEKAQKYDLTMAQIALTVRDALKGGVATTIKPSQAEEGIDVLVRFPENLRTDVKVFDKIYVANTGGSLIPLSSVARIEEIDGIYQINHLDGKRVIMIAAEVDNKQATSFRVNQLLQNKFQDIPKEYLGSSIIFKGEYEEQKQSFQNITISFLLVLFFIFIILAHEFKSLIQPLLIMLTIPFGFTGVIYTFFLHGKPLSFFALLGIVGLAGVVVNASIILVDFINRLRNQGMDLTDSLIEAGRIRLRPILMTSTTTMGGLVSVAYGIGGGDPFLKPMALAIFWGLFFSTTSTLFVIPCVYGIIDDLTLKIFPHSLVKRNEEQIPR